MARAAANLLTFALAHHKELALPRPRMNDHFVRTFSHESIPAWAARLPLSTVVRHPPRNSAPRFCPQSARSLPAGPSVAPGSQPAEIAGLLPQIHPGSMDPMQRHQARSAGGIRNSAGIRQSPGPRPLECNRTVPRCLDTLPNRRSHSMAQQHRLILPRWSFTFVNRSPPSPARSQNRDHMSETAEPVQPHGRPTPVKVEFAVVICTRFPGSALFPHDPRTIGNTS